MARRLPAALLAGTAVCLCASAPLRVPAAEQDGRRPRSLREDSPRLLSLEITAVPGDTHTVHVVAQYAPDARLGERLTLQLANGPVTFARQTGGRFSYSADIRLTDEQLASLTRRDQALRKLNDQALHFEYDGRRLTGSSIAAPLSLFSLRAMPGDGDVAPRLPVLDVHGRGEDDAGGEVPALTASNAQAYLAVGGLVPDPMDVLMITDRRVVGDCARTWDPCDAGSRAPNGVWTFAHLMRSLPGVTDAAALTKEWLQTWQTNHVVAPAPVPTAGPRPGIAGVLADWPRLAGTDTLDLDQAPLRLLAIVNRPDLADNLTFPAAGAAASTPGSAGELRFVFDVAPIVDSQWGKRCAVMKFQVILEYRVEASTCDDVKQWAQRWIDLAALGRGTDAYNQALAAITEDVVVNHKGAIARVRTNEIDLASGNTKLWEMREFELDGSGATPVLKERPVRRTPPDDLNRSDELATLVNAKAGDIVLDKHDISGQEGANPQMEQGTFWSGDPVGSVQIHDPSARFHFSLNTCTGCHARETCTGFNHVRGGNAGAEACLSQFLAGDQNVPDPVLCAEQECSKPGDLVCPPTPTSTRTLPAGTAAATPTVTATRTCHQLPTNTVGTGITPATPSATSTLGIPTVTVTPPSPSATATAGTPVATPTVTATATATATYNACFYKPNDLQRRRQALDQLTMCIFPNGFVRLDATH